MDEKIEFFRSLDSVIIPHDWTYFHHSTSYMPTHIKERFDAGKYARCWTTVPTEDFTIRREMSFVDRDSRIKDALDYRKPMSELSVLYNLPDYAKPFCIRVIIPKITRVRDGSLPVSEDYKREHERIYSGYGDWRHAKLTDKEKIIIIGRSTTDEVSGKSVDILYGIRECDVDLYYNSLVDALINGFVEETEPNFSQGKYGDFYPGTYGIPKINDLSRFKGEPSEFELELLEDYKEELEGKDGTLSHIPDGLKYRRMYDNYQPRNNVPMI